jgi:tRNA A37 methylthiotransferase MiaB
VAADMDAPSHEVRAARSRRLRALFEDKWDAFRTRMLGQELPAVVLRGRNRRGRLWALTDNYLKVEIEGSDRLQTQQVRVRVTELDGTVTRGMPAV